MQASTLISILSAATTWGISRSGLALLCLLEKTAMRPKDIAPIINMTEAGVHCAAKPLVSRRIIEKKRDTDGDDRAVHYSLTLYGQGILQNILSGTTKPTTPA